MSHLPGETTWWKDFSADFKTVQWRKPFVHARQGGCTAAGGMLSTAAAIISLLPPPPARVLDAGCAEGHLSQILSLTGYEVTAIDVCGDVMKEAEERLTMWNGQTSNVRFIVCDYDNIPQVGYDAIIFTDALHHSRDRSVTLRSAYNGLKEGGLLIANEPGIGHGASAKEWASKMNVTERSVIPLVLAREARRVGFKDIRFYPNPTTLHKSAYEPDGLAHHKLVRFAVKLFGANLVAAAKHFHGLTTMRK